MRYGVPYQGSKNGIAEWVVEHLPPAENLYDLFAGGCAITHAAILSGKWRRIFCNDINGEPVSLFFDAVAGKFEGEKRWISREDFFALKEKEPYVKYCWSFGNNGQGYLYSREIEPWKKALHYARAFGDFSLFSEMGVEFSQEERQSIRIAIRRRAFECRDKYVAWHAKNVLREERLFSDFLSGKEIECGKETLGRIRRLAKLACKGGEKSHPKMDELESLERLQRLQRLQSLQSLQSLRGLRTDRVVRLCGSYDDVEILPNSVIYCDIPYRGTRTEAYAAAGEKDCGFDYERFYAWTMRQTELCVISEYSMPNVTKSLCGADAESGSEITRKAAKKGGGMPVEAEEIGGAWIFSEVNGS